MEREDEDEVYVLVDANSHSISFLLVFYNLSRGARTAKRIVGFCPRSRSMAHLVWNPHTPPSFVVVRPTRAVCWPHHKLIFSM